MKNKVLKSGIWYVLGDLLVKGMMFLTTPVFSRILSKSEYGNVSDFLAWYAVLSIVATLSFDATLNRARFDYQDEFEAYKKSTLLCSFLVTCILYLLTVVFGAQSEILFGMERKWMMLLFLSVCFLPALTYYQTCKMIEYDYRKNVAISLLVSVTGVVLSLVLISLMPQKDTAYIVGMQLPGITVGLILFLRAVLKPVSFKTGYCTYALKVCLPYVPHLLSMSLLTNADRIMIKRVCGLEEVAVYSIAYSASFAISILLNAVNKSMSPWLGERLYEKQYSTIRSVSKTYVLVFVIPAVLFMLVVPEVLFILGGAQYYEARYILAPLVMSCICQFFYTMYVNVEQYEKRTGGMAIASVMAALLNIILNYIFIPKYGYCAAAYTTLASYAALLLMHILLVYRIGLIKVYATYYNLLVFALALAAMGICVVLYRCSFIYRYILLAAGCAAVLLIIRKNMDKYKFIR